MIQWLVSWGEGGRDVERRNGALRLTVPLENSVPKLGEAEKISQNVCIFFSKDKKLKEVQKVKLENAVTHFWR